MELENVNPNVYRKIEDRSVTPEEEDDNVVDEFDEREIFGKFKKQPNLTFRLTLHISQTWFAESTTPNIHSH